jgi:DHA1 family purine ribonucleoside efflux pump-like MFS transporter
VAGQSVTVTAFVAMFASLFITQVIGTIDRRKVTFSACCTLPACWSPLPKLHPAAAGARLSGAGAGRLLGDVGLAHHAPGARATVPKALSVIFGAVSIALVIAAPLGSFLGGIIGWRNVFNAAAVMGLLCIIWVWKALPSLPGEAAHHKQNMFALLKRPACWRG